MIYIYNLVIFKTNLSICELRRFFASHARTFAHSIFGRTHIARTCAFCQNSNRTRTCAFCVCFYSKFAHAQKKRQPRTSFWRSLLYDGLVENPKVGLIPMPIALPIYSRDCRAVYSQVGVLNFRVVCFPVYWHTITKVCFKKKKKFSA